jgi:alkylation response protein AidB-like acyl-CoA dehydrogenase
MAKAAADEAAAFAVRIALQVHGAIGYTWDHDLHVFMRRAWSLGQEWGDAAFHRARVAEAVLGGATPIGPGTTF